MEDLCPWVDRICDPKCRAWVVKSPENQYCARVASLIHISFISKNLKELVGSMDELVNVTLANAKGDHARKK